MALHGKTYKNLLEKLPQREEFNAGGRAYGEPNVRGRKTSGGVISVGHLNEEETKRLLKHADQIDYIVWSYGTPIAWHLNLKSPVWYVVKQAFSASTSGHQSAVRSALRGEETM